MHVPPTSHGRQEPGADLTEREADLRVAGVLHVCVKSREGVEGGGDGECGDGVGGFGIGRVGGDFR